jgi:hypothetical protein
VSLLAEGVTVTSGYVSTSPRCHTQAHDGLSLLNTAPPEIFQLPGRDFTVLMLPDVDR